VLLLGDKIPFAQLQQGLAHCQNVANLPPVGHDHDDGMILIMSCPVEFLTHVVPL
jgi:hypothetical protein